MQLKFVINMDIEVCVITYSMSRQKLVAYAHGITKTWLGNTRDIIIRGLVKIWVDQRC